MPMDKTPREQLLEELLTECLCYVQGHNWPTTLYNLFENYDVWPPADKFEPLDTDFIAALRAGSLLDMSDVDRNKQRVPHPALRLWRQMREALDLPVTR